MITISNRISYLPASDNPLSSDVGFVHGKQCEWIFDVGSNNAAAEAIQSIPREKKVVLSHFHQDHTANLARVCCAVVYCGAYTKKKLGTGTAVCTPVTINDGGKLTIFPLSSTHAKGTLGLEVDEEFAFLGDAIYGVQKNGKTAWNVTLLKEMIQSLSALKADRFLLSHDADYVKPKSEVLAELNRIYRLRRPGEPVVFL